MIVSLLMRRQRPEDVVVLLPHCLQLHTCTCTVGESVEHCNRCGACALAAIADFCAERHLKAFVVSGGQLAVQKIKEYKPKLIIAVACQKELLLGIVSVFPRPVYAIPNSIHHTPCKDTSVDIALFKQAIERFVKQENAK